MQTPESEGDDTDDEGSDVDELESSPARAPPAAKGTQGAVARAPKPAAKAALKAAEDRRVKGGGGGGGASGQGSSAAAVAADESGSELSMKAADEQFEEEDYHW